MIGRLFVMGREPSGKNFLRGGERGQDLDPLDGVIILAHMPNADLYIFKRDASKIPIKPMRLKAVISLDFRAASLEC
ncbi:hypothetical protein ACNHKD_03720 [Methylocystis sp. JAN1]|uniref:hypothetical protein n=1 Tax=Methylocystis sp. JAN1 TaxID=3397211 RepID=UPI003FA2552C